MCKYCEFSNSNSSYIDATDVSCSDSGFSLGLYHESFYDNGQHYLFGEYCAFEDETVNSDLADNISSRDGYSTPINFCPFCGRKL